MSRQVIKEKQGEEKSAPASVGFVSERYAGVSSIQFKMTYYHRSVNPVLMERTLTLSRDNYAGFRMQCLTDGCINGGFDLEPVVSALVKSGRNSTRGRIACRGKHAVHHHASLGYEVKIEYTGKVKKRAGTAVKQP